METIKSNPQCAIEEIVKIALVERKVKTLKEKGVLERVGTKKMEYGL